MRHKENENLLPSTCKDILTKVGGECQLTFLDLISERNHFKRERNPEAVFNVLDALLKDTLDRLKVMRDNISLAEEGFQGCILDVNYHRQLDMIRDLCFEREVDDCSFTSKKGNNERFYS